jgi:hypothetical protein
MIMLEKNFSMKKIRRLMLNPNKGERVEVEIAIVNAI